MAENVQEFSIGRMIKSITFLAMSCIVLLPFNLSYLNFDNAIGYASYPIGIMLFFYILLWPWAGGLFRYVDESDRHKRNRLNGLITLAFLCIIGVVAYWAYFMDGLDKQTLLDIIDAAPTFTIYMNLLIISFAAVASIIYIINGSSVRLLNIIFIILMIIFTLDIIYEAYNYVGKSERMSAQYKYIFAGMTVKLFFTSMLCEAATPKETSEILEKKEPTF